MNPVDLCHVREASVKLSRYGSILFAVELQGQQRRQSGSDEGEHTTLSQNERRMAGF